MVKLLDFGLAKMLETEAAASMLSMSPTMSVHATYTGVILRTRIRRRVLGGTGIGLGRVSP